MYLNRLNDNQKELFIDISIHAAESNNEFAEQEKELINQYCNEMNIFPARYTANSTLDDAMNKLINISTEEEKRMIVVELTGLVLSDNNFDKFEQQFMDDLSQKLKLDNNQIAYLIRQLNSLTEIYGNIDRFVSEG